MADKKISELPSLASISDSDLLAIVNAGVTKKVLASVLKTYIAGSFVELAGDTMTGNLLFTTGLGIDTTATGGSDVLNIGSTNANIINIGRAGAIVNIFGNVDITDALITLNKGGGAGTGGGVGFEIEVDGQITGFFKTVASGDGYVMQAPTNTNYLQFDIAASSATITANEFFGNDYSLLLNSTGATGEVKINTNFRVLSTGIAQSPSFSVSGTAGAGYYAFTSQASDPSPGAINLVLFENSNSDLAWRKLSDTFTRVLTGAITANRSYTLPDISGNILCSSSVNSVSPTAPDRTLTVNIGGVTLYVAAKTTND